MYSAARFYRPSLTALITLGLAFGLTGAARAQDPAPPAEAPQAAAAAPAAAPAVDPALAARIEEIAQSALIAQRKVELLEEAAATAKTTAPVLTASDKGFNWKSADGAFVVKVRGYIHADAREFKGPNDINQGNKFLVRRARPVLEASFFDVADFRLMPDFGGGTAALYDAYIDLRPFPWLKLRAGKFKPPVGLERLQSATAIVFPERALPTALAPNRDVGFQLHGVIGPGAVPVPIVTYELGLFNGVVDGTLGDTDNNYAKDVIGRLFFQPFKADPYAVLSSLGLGVAGSIGGQRGALTTPGVPTFRTGGQNNFFQYLANATNVDATVIGRGRRTRIAPQGYYYYESFGLLGEWTQSSQSVVKGANITTLTHRAWQVLASYVLGGKNAFEGVTVAAPFNPKTGALGALELGARYNELKLDDDTFPTFGNPVTQAKKAQAFGAVLNWHWSKNIKVSAAYERTAFKGGADKDGNKAAENVFIQRVQAAF